MDTTAPIVLYVYCCEACRHQGQLHLVESGTEVTTACASCGAEVQAEWDGGVELATNEPEKTETLISSPQATFYEKQEQANRIEGQFDTLKDRVVVAGYGNKYSDEEISAMRTEMAVLSSQYFDLTGLILE